MKLILYLCTFILLLGCTEEKTKVYFVQLNDVYEIAPLGGGLYGGMARVAHVVDSLKALNPNTYLFMSGDFLNPSLLGNLKHHGERIKGRQMIEVMNAMHFTMATFGNHEFDLSYDDFQKRLDESSFDWVNTNCYHNTEQGITPFAKWANLNTTAYDSGLDSMQHEPQNPKTPKPQNPTNLNIKIYQYSFT